MSKSWGGRDPKVTDQEIFVREAENAPPSAARTTGALMFPIKNWVAPRYAPVVTWCLIASNCAIFLFQTSLGPTEQEWLLLRFALIPARDFNASGCGWGRQTI